MTQSRPRFRRSVFVALLKEEEVLTVVEHNGQVGFPGGRVERAETWMGALSREFLEEVGARLPFKRYTHVGWGTPYYEIRVFVAHITNEDAELIFKQSEQSGEPTDVRSWAWTPRSGLAKLRLRPHIQAAMSMLDAISASPVGRESEWTLRRQETKEAQAGARDTGDTRDPDAMIHTILAGMSPLNLSAAPGESGANAAKK